MRVPIVAGCVALLIGGCINAAEPRGSIFQYGIAVHACESTSCSAPDSVAVLTTAAPGDTVWLRHAVTLLQSVDALAPATIRPECAENATVAFGATTVQALPEPITCADSTAVRVFERTETLVIFTQWVLDAALVSGNAYTVTGRVLVQPRIEPTFNFLVQ